MLLPLTALTRVSSSSVDATRPESKASSITDANCCVQGTCLSKSQHGIFSSVEVGFDIRVDHPTDASWIVRCTLRDVCSLHHNLRQHITDRDFHDDIARLPCPKQPFFHRRDMLVIKGLCVDLDHYIDELLKLCHRFTSKQPRSPDADRVEAYLRTFLSSTTSPSSPI